MSIMAKTPLIRRFVVLAVLLVLMLGAEALGTPSIGPKPLILAAIGFVILASFSVAEMGSALALPRVTGYIITGAVLNQTGILSSAVADELKMFNTIALGLIAIGAGLELSVSSLARLSRTLLATTTAKVLLVFPTVGAVSYAYMYFAPGLGLPAPALDSPQAIVAFALVMGALALGTSPSISLAVISELKSKGRVSDLVLGAAVLKDIVVVVVLAVAMAVASGLLSGGQIDPSSLSYVAKEVTFSILAGLALGGLLIAYIRYIKAEMLLFVAAMILSVAEVSRLLHLELLLVFIAGGFVVRNFSPYEHELSRPVELVSLPIFVVFFTIAGASVDLQSTLLYLPLALALATTRALGFRVAAGLGNRLGAEAPHVRKNVWLGYLPQAGVTLGLLGLAIEKLSPLAPALKSGGMAFVAVNLLLGPVALRLALKRAGEATGEKDTEQPSAMPVASGDPRLAPELAHPLDALLGRLQTEVIDQALAEQRRFAEATSESYQALLRAMRQRGSSAPGLWAAFRARLEALDAEQAQDSYIRARGLIRTLPHTVAVPRDPDELRTQPDDAAAVRRRKRLRRALLAVTFRRAGLRQVPLLRLARESLEVRLAELSIQNWTSKMRLCAALLEELAQCERRAGSDEEAQEIIPARIEEWQANVAAELRTLIPRAVTELAPFLQKFDTPYLPAAKHRRVDIDLEVRTAFSAFGAATDWLRSLDASYQRWTVTHALKVLQHEVNERVHVLLSGAAEASVRTLHDQVLAWEQEAKSLEQGRSHEDFLERCNAHRNALAEEPRALVEAATADVRQALDLRPLVHWLKQQVSALKDAVTLTALNAPVSQTEDPRALSFRTVEVRRLAEARLLKTAVTHLEADAQVFEAGFRDLCAALLRAQDDFRVALRASGTHSGAQHAALSALGLLHEAYRQCALGLSALLVQLRSAEHDTMTAAVSSVTGSVLLQGAIGVQQGRRKYLLALLRLSKGRASGFVATTLGNVRTWWQRRGGQIFGGVLDELAVRAGQRVVDAQSLRSTLQAIVERDQGDYATHFSLEPIRDPGRFVAHRELLDDLVTMETKWLRGGAGSALLVGEHGSGKSSLLNMLHFRVTASRILRLEPLEWRRQVGITRALAYSLGCAPKVEALRVALSERPTQVLIDDLEQWVRAGEPGMRDMVRFLEIVCSTRKHVFWTATMNRDFFELLSESVELNTSFGRLMELPALTRMEVREVIAARHLESGKRLELPRTLASWLRWKALSFSDDDLVFELIRRSSAGNLSRALILWTLLTKVEDDDCVRLHASRAPLSASMPFLRHLDGEELALLVLLNRLGPLSLPELSEQLCIEHPHLQRIVHFFDAGGLIERSESDGLIRIASHCSALTSLGLRGVLTA